MLRVEAQHRLELLEGFIKAPSFGQRDPVIEMALNEARFEPDDLRKLRQRLVAAVLPGEVQR